MIMMVGNITVVALLDVLIGPIIYSATGCVGAKNDDRTIYSTASSAAGHVLQFLPSTAKHKAADHRPLVRVRAQNFFPFHF